MGSEMCIRDRVIKFADRPENRAGEDGVWDQAENALREAINDCGSMIRKYQNDETKKDIRGFWWEQVIKLTKQRKKVLKQEHKDRKEVLDYLT